MATPLGTTFSTDEQVVAQGATVSWEKRSSHLLWNSIRKSMKRSSLLAPRALGWHGSTVGSPRRFALKSLRRLPQRWPAQTTPFLAASRVWCASTSPTRLARPTSLKVNLATHLLFLSSRLPRVPNNPWSVNRMLNVDKGIAHVDNRCKKLEKSSVQQIQNARLKPASLLNRIRCAKSTSGYQNAELKRLVFLAYRHDVQQCEVRVPSQRTRPASLQ